MHFLLFCVFVRTTLGWMQKLTAADNSAQHPEMRRVCFIAPLPPIHPSLVPPRVDLPGLPVFRSSLFFRSSLVSPSSLPLVSPSRLSLSLSLSSLPASPPPLSPLPSIPSTPSLPSLLHPSRATASLPRPFLRQPVSTRCRRPCNCSKEQRRIHMSGRQPLLVALLARGPPIPPEPGPWDTDSLPTHSY